MSIARIIVLSWIFGLPALVFGQQTNPLLRLEDSFQFDKLRSYLQMVEQHGGGTPAAHYLKALLSEDAAEALKIYQSVMTEDSLGVYADRALWRIAQYYFIKGDYREAYTVLLDLVDKYPQSSTVTKARDQMNRLAAVIASAPATAQPSKPPNASKVSTAGNNSSVSSSLNRGKFTIQTGAFSSMENAQFMQNYLKEQGFPDGFISKRQIAGKTLFLVWVGSFISQDDAKKESERLKKKIRNLEVAIKPLP